MRFLMYVVPSTFLGQVLTWVLGVQLLDCLCRGMLSKMAELPLQHFCALSRDRTIKRKLYSKVKKEKTDSGPVKVIGNPNSMENHKGNSEESIKQLATSTLTSWLGVENMALQA